MVMSSDDDGVVLQKHRGKLALGSVRPATRPALDVKAARRQSRDPQSSQFSQVLGSSRQSRDMQPARKSVDAPPDDDSDDDAHMLQKRQSKLLSQAKVHSLPVTDATHLSLLLYTLCILTLSAFTGAF